MGGTAGQALAMIALGAMVGAVASVIAFRVTRGTPLGLLSGFVALVTGTAAGVLGGLLGCLLGDLRDKITPFYGGSVGGGALVGFLVGLVAKRLPSSRPSKERESELPTSRPNERVWTVALVLARVTWGVLLIPLGFVWFIAHHEDYILRGRGGAPDTTVPLILPATILCSVTAVYLLVAALLVAAGRTLSRNRKTILISVTAVAIAAEAAFPFATRSVEWLVKRNEQGRVRSALDRYLQKVSRGEFDAAWNSFSPKRQGQFPLTAYLEHWKATLGSPPANLTWSYGERCLPYSNYTMCDVEVRVAGSGREQVENLTYFVLPDGQVDACVRTGASGHDEPW